MKRQIWIILCWIFIIIPAINLGIAVGGTMKAYSNILHLWINAVASHIWLALIVVCLGGRTKYKDRLFGRWKE